MKITNYFSDKHSFHYHHSVTPKSENVHMHGPEWHHQFEIIYLVEGEVKYQIGGEEYLARTGDVIFVMPNEIHSLRTNNQMPYDRIVLIFDLEILRKMLAVSEIDLSDAFLTVDCPYRIIPDSLVRKYGIKDILCSIDKYHKEKDCNSLHFFSSVFSLMISLHNLFSDGGHEPILPVSDEPIVRKVIQYIDDHIYEPILLDDIAASLYVSKSTLCHRFAGHMNVSVNRYIAIKKIYHAAELIRGGMSATEASLALGYNHYTTFYHNYKQIIGSPPSTGRRG